MLALLFLASLFDASARSSSCWEGKVTVPGGHVLHVQIQGDCSGPSLLYFHGGWGPLSHDLDIVPAEYRIVYFHQRGWGLSEPQGSVENNTYDDVVNDAKLIQQQFSRPDERWVVFGGSNGATLALQYAALFPAEVRGVVLRGYWAMTPEQISWDYFGQGKHTVYPEEWDLMCESADCNEANILEHYHEALAGLAGDDGCAGSSPPAGCAVGCAFLRYDSLGSAINLVPHDVCIPPQTGDAPDWYQLHPLAAARLGIHFYRMTHTVPDVTGLITENVSMRFVNGRLDFLCPPGWAAEVVAGAIEAHGARDLWKTTIVEHAAHSGTDPGMTPALQAAFREFLPDRQVEAGPLSAVFM